MSLSQLPKEESSSTKLSCENDLSAQASLLLSFQPIEFFSEWFQTVDNVLCDSLDSLKASLDKKCYPTQYESDLAKGIQYLQDFLVEESDFQFDLFELYALYNIFRIPSNLSSLPPSVEYFSDTSDLHLATKLDDELEEVARDIRSLRYCKKQLERELRLLNHDLHAFEVIRPILQRVSQENPVFLSKYQLQTTMNALKDILKVCEQCTQLKEKIEQSWISSTDWTPPASNPRLKVDVSNITLADLQKMTLKLRQPFSF